LFLTKSSPKIPAMMITR